MKGGWQDPGALPKGPTGRPLCRCGCGQECLGRRRTFATEKCVEGWRLKTDPGFVRAKLLERDKGRCGRCGINTVALQREILAILTHAGRLERMGRLVQEGWPRSLYNRLHGSLWDADHIVPVAEGGGECDLTNFQTLCLKCHKDKTAAMRRKPAAPTPEQGALPIP